MTGIELLLWQESRLASGEPQSPYSTLRRLVAESLQRGNISSRQALECMHALDAADKPPRERCASADHEPQTRAMDVADRLDELDHLCGCLVNEKDC